MNKLTKEQGEYFKDSKMRDENGNLNMENIRKTMQFIAQAGVKDKVIVHCKQAGFCYDVPSGKFSVVASLDIPPEKILGSVGAGDAFCAGVAIGLTYGKNLKGACDIGAHLAASVIVTTESVCPRFMPRELGLNIDVKD